jgi:hypothetical protein
MEKDRNLIVYRAIANEDHTIELSVGEDLTKGVLYYPSLTFLDHPTMKDEYWDNENFIFEKFYQFASRWKNRRMINSDLLEFQFVLNKLDEESMNTLIDIIELAKELGWDKSENI